jgi:hypothetical protein
LLVALLDDVLVLGERGRGQPGVDVHLAGAVGTRRGHRAGAGGVVGVL